MTDKPTIKDSGENTYHRDGTVSHWDVYRQVWRRLPADRIEDRVLASMREDERQSIKEQAA